MKSPQFELNNKTSSREQGVCRAFRDFGNVSKLKLLKASNTKRSCPDFHQLMTGQYFILVIFFYISIHFLVEHHHCRKKTHSVAYSICDCEQSDGDFISFV